MSRTPFYQPAVAAGAARSPCLACPHFSRCKSMLLACEDFAHYVGTGVMRSSAERAPTHRQFVKTMGEDA